MSPRLSIRFARGGELNFYNCSVARLEQRPEEIYDWTVDLMSPKWNEFKAMRSVLSRPEAYLCDILLDQEIFAGSGNIIKNEVLFRLGLHPLVRVRELSSARVRALVHTVHDYCFDFYRWKKDFVLRKNWKIYRQTNCRECGARSLRQKLGERQRVNFTCPACQKKLRGRTKAA